MTLIAGLKSGRASIDFHLNAGDIHQQSSALASVTYINALPQLCGDGAHLHQFGACAYMLLLWFGRCEDLPVYPDAALVVCAGIKVDRSGEEDGAECRSRTCDLRFRRPTLYPAELIPRKANEAVPRRGA